MSVQAPSVIAAKKLKESAASLLAPGAAAWGSVPGVEVSLEPTPLDRVPSAYVQKAWQGKARGNIRSATVKAAVSKEGTVAIRVSWAAANPSHGITDYNVYADACGILFPAKGDADLGTMGSPQKPVVAWYWRAGAGQPYVADATGLGTVARDAAGGVQTEGSWADGAWNVVFAAKPGTGRAPIRADGATKIGFAIWSGAAEERAGIKSHSPAWQELRVG